MRPATPGLALIMAAVVYASVAVAAPAPPSVIYLNGNILTVDDRQPHAQALAVRDGRILAVGTDRDITRLRGADTRMVDLTGKTMVPGFVDGHSHISNLVSIWNLADLSPAPVGTTSSIADLQKMMRAYLAANPGPDDRMVIGRGYDDSLMTERRHPSLGDLNAVSATRPVCVIHVSGHLARCNSAALRRMGLDAATPDPKGGRLGRDADGKLNGGLDEQAVGLALALVPAQDPAEALKALDAVQTFYASQGYTTVQDGLTSSSAAAGFLQAASAAGLLRLDVASYLRWSAVDAIVAENRIKIGGPYVGHLKFAGVKITADGSPQGKTAFLREPYLHPPENAETGYRGYPTVQGDELVELYDRFMGRGWQVQTHCNGDACIDLLLAAVTKAYAAHAVARGTRPIVIHSQVTRQDQLKAYQALGIFPSFFAEHTFYWGDWHRDETLGSKRAPFISPAAAALALGVKFSLHTDAPVVPPSGLHAWWSAVNRTTRSGKVLGPDQRISSETALKALTLWPAWQHFDEAIKGSITPGKFADLVILDADPTKINPAKIKDVRVLLTIKAGQVIYERDATAGVRRPFAVEN